MNKHTGICRIRWIVGLALIASARGPWPARADDAQEPGEETTELKAPTKTAPADEGAESADAGADEAFPYSFSDVSANLVVIECRSPAGNTTGSGFIAKMDGKTYIVTNQHVIMGVRPSFTTATGEQIKPMAVELSASRDIARLPIADRAEALEIGDNIDMGTPLAIFGNTEGEGATELSGAVTGLGAELIEVSAEFESEHSGSPVLGRDGKVIGIASYVHFSRPNRMTENTRFDKKARRFCFRMNGAKWVQVPWRKYNAAYGTLYRETDAAVSSIFDIINGLFDKPFGSVSATCSDSELKSWASAHNRTLRHSASGEYRQIGNSAEALSAYCDRRARALEKVLKHRDLTGFLRDEFEGYVYALDYATEALGYFESHLSTMQ